MFHIEHTASVLHNNLRPIIGIYEYKYSFTNAEASDTQMSGPYTGLPNARERVKDSHDLDASKSRGFLLTEILQRELISGEKRSRKHVE